MYFYKSNILLVIVIEYMSGSRSMDEHLYKEKLIRQTRPGMYQYSSPTPDCPSCFPQDSYVRPQFSGAPMKSSYAPVDVESDIRGLDRPNNRIRTYGHHH